MVSLIILHRSHPEALIQDPLGPQRSALCATSSAPAPVPAVCRRGRRRSWIGSVMPLRSCAEPLSADRAAAAACAEHRRLAGGHRVPRARLAREAHDRKVVRDAVALQHVVPRCNMLCSACNMLCRAAACCAPYSKGNPKMHYGVAPPPRGNRAVHGSPRERCCMRQWVPR